MSLGVPTIGDDDQPASGLWVFVEQRQGEVLPVGLEILGEARKLASRLRSEVSAILIGDRVAAQADDLIAYGADRVYVAAGPTLENYDGDRYASIVVALVREHRPQILLLGATYLGRDLAPAVAARLDTGLCADCIRLDLDDHGSLLQIAPVLGGRELATMLCPVKRPQMATIRPGVFTKHRAEGRTGEIVRVKVHVPDRGQVKLRGVYREESPGHPLEQAEIVVAGGAGVGGADGWELIHELAAALGASVGGTRPPLDDGYLRENQMIGQSGVTIKPKLYICIGISGDVQHTIGFQDAGTVVAINNDPNAPIFKVADYGIVGDYRKVVPLLIKALRRG